MAGMNANPGTIRIRMCKDASTGDVYMCGEDVAKWLDDLAESCADDHTRSILRIVAGFVRRRILEDS